MAESTYKQPVGRVGPQDTLPVSLGGTGATTAAEARANLGAAAIGPVGIGGLVDSDGSVSRSTGGFTVTKVGTGQYQIDGTGLSQLFIAANPLDGFAATCTIGNDNGHPARAVVNTYDSGAPPALVDASFMLVGIGVV